MNLTAPASVYRFFRTCSTSPLEKKVLDCGAGGICPPLSIFHDFGYEVHGIDISDKQLELVRGYEEKTGSKLNIIKGDMRNLPFDDEEFSFVYSFNSIFHMSKEDTAAAVKEMERVLKKDGLCFINFLSKCDEGFGEGEEAGDGEYLQEEFGEQVIHSYYEDDEADKYFSNFELRVKEKKIVDFLYEGQMHRLSYIEYIAAKK